ARRRRRGSSRRRFLRSSRTRTSRSPVRSRPASASDLRGNPMTQQRTERSLSFVNGPLLAVCCGAAVAVFACRGPLPPPPSGTTNINTTSRPIVPGNGMTPVLTSALAADPGPRAGDPGAGGPFPGLTDTEKTYFTAALETFKEVDSVSGTLPEEDGKGLGPTFN